MKKYDNYKSIISTAPRIEGELAESNNKIYMYRNKRWIKVENRTIIINSDN